MPSVLSRVHGIFLFLIPSLGCCSPATSRTAAPANLASARFTVSECRSSSCITELHECVVGDVHPSVGARPSLRCVHSCGQDDGGFSIAPVSFLTPRPTYDLAYLASSSVMTTASSLLFRIPTNMPLNIRWSIFAALLPLTSIFCKLPGRAAVLAATEPRDAGCCMIGSVGHDRVSGADRYPIPELGCIFETPDRSSHSPDRSFNVSVGCVRSNGAVLWCFLNVL